MNMSHLTPIRWRSFLPHLAAIVLFLLLSYLYFYPLLLGKTVAQTDRDQWQGSAQELEQYRQTHNGEQSLWTGSMFSGMPAVMVSLTYDKNLISPLDNILNFGARPASYLFIAMLGFYILLLVLDVNPWLAIVGAVGYAFSTYFFIIVGAGHNAKLHAITYMAPMVAGVLLAYKGKYIAGAGLFALSFALSLATGHIQITYYTFFILLAVAIWRLVELVRAKQLRTFVVASAFLVLAGVLGVGANFNRLYQTYDYGKASIRGKSYLAETAEQKEEGLDKSYATQWSYGKLESFNLLIPNLYGGSSAMELSTDSEVGRFLRKMNLPQEQERAILKQLPVYWGDQPMTSGPVYLGAVVIFLFFFSFFLMRGAPRWALLIVSLVALFLAWGHNLQWFTDFFFAVFPGYNKFRSVSMILVICEFCVPLLGFWGLSEWLRGNYDNKRAQRALFLSLASLLGILLLFLVFGSLGFNFVSQNDAQYVQMGYPSEFMTALSLDRAALMRSDVLRSALFILLGGGVLWFFLRGKLKQTPMLLALGVLVLLDLWLVNKRYDGVVYVNKSHNAQPFPMTSADRQILQDKSYYRVFNTSVSPFNDASTSYYHKSIGGYHGVKLRRYQDLIDRYAGTPAMLNLTNTKYIIGRDREGYQVQQNPAALGNAWFVDRVAVVDSPNAELDSIGRANVDRVAYILKTETLQPTNFAPKDSLDQIELVHYEPNRLTYRVATSGERFAVFSEVFYPKGWVATIDGVEAPIYRVDYLLRGVQIPAGAKEIVFSFSLPSYFMARWVDFAFGLLILLALVVALYLQMMPKKAQVPQQISAENGDR